jgi:hypothetical protein
VETQSHQQPTTLAPTTSIAPPSPSHSVSSQDIMKEMANNRVFQRQERMRKEQENGATQERKE